MSTGVLFDYTEGLGQSYIPNRTFWTSGFQKIQDGGQKRNAVCEFAKNNSVEERKEKHNRWYDLKNLWDEKFLYHKMWFEYYESSKIRH